jgi:predicted O-methyltransferase YrrM
VLVNYLQRKIHNFRRDPIALIVGKMRALPHSFNRETYARIRLSQNGVLEPLVRFVAARPRGALEPVFNHLWYLYGLVRHRKPATVLEFGSGCSTFVIAQALRDNKKGFLYSIESSAEWADHTIRSMPDSVTDVLKIVHCPVRGESRDGMQWLRHTNLPAVVPDIVFLDGPPLGPGDVAVDVIDMEDRLSPGFVLIVDKRDENTEFLKRRLKRDYSLRKQNDLTVFELRS